MARLPLQLLTPSEKARAIGEEQGRVLGPERTLPPWGLRYPRVISQQTALTISGILGLVLTLGIAFVDSAATLNVPTFGEMPVAVFFLALCGLANAIMWPAIWPLALSGLGKLTSVASGLLVMGIAGGAFGPLFLGLAKGSEATVASSQTAYLVLLPCYLFILFYALKGHKMRSWK